MKRVHLDFHTSPDIPNIGSKFNKTEFTEALKKSHIDSMTVFAKCHHGYTYYPSRVGTMHPGLSFDLLREEIDAIHAAGARAPIYITVGWSKKDADEHPEWHSVDFDTHTTSCQNKPISDDPDAPIPECSWINLCPSGPYLDHLKAITDEVCREFHPVDGIFFDIVFAGSACVCEACKVGMRKRGLDPSIRSDAEKYYIDRRVEVIKELGDLVHSHNPAATVFFNSGGADMNRPAFHPYSTHYELEDLPTAWGGYDEMPIRAKYFEKYGKDFVGMTGKFHHDWGEFGGFKSKDALKYEMADMMSVGAMMSIGDHLHPSGKLDESTYRGIGYAYEYIDSIKEYARDTIPHTDLALRIRHNKDTDIGASKLLGIAHLEYDVIDVCESLDKYSCVIIPEGIDLSADEQRELVSFTERGGKILVCYDSVFDGLGIRKLEPSSCDKDFIQCDELEVTTPFLAYSSAYKVEPMDQGANTKIFAKVHEPYFNRTYRHFCGHKNTPFKTEPEEYPALMQNGNVTYLAHPIFEAYNKSGNYLLEQLIIKAIDLAYDRMIKTQNLPSAGKIRLRKSKNANFYVLHTLYSSPINRGNVHLLADFPTIHDVEITLKTTEDIHEIIALPSGERLSFKQGDNSISFTLPPFSMHQLIILNW